MFPPSFLNNVYSVLWNEACKSLNGGSNKVINFLYYSTDFLKNKNYVKSLIDIYW